MQPVGYAYDADVHCEDCSERMFPNIRESSDGMEDSEGNEPSAIFSDSESDVPEHCGDCGTFLGTNLTSDGYAYVVEALARGNGNPETLQTWFDAYSEWFDPEDWQTLARAWIPVPPDDPNQTTLPVA